MAEKHSPLFLFVHLYTGDISTEQLPPLRRMQMIAGKLQNLQPLPYDTLIELKKK